MSEAYKAAGVNQDLGNAASRILYEAARQTWANRQGILGEIVEPLGDFSGMRYWRISNLPDGTIQNIGFDGTGTKIEVAERTSNHETVAFDLLAMVCDDAVTKGAEPIAVGSVLDVNTLGDDERNHLNCVKQLAQGYVPAAEAAGVAVVNGEIAELGARVQGYGAFNYNWGAGVVLFANEQRLFTRSKIQAGDCLVGLCEDGFRSNGISLVRKTLGESYGSAWHIENFPGSNETLGDLVLMPSRIYAKSVTDMFGGWNLERDPKAEVHGIAHITGGGIPEKLGRVLPKGLGAMIHNPTEPSEIMFHVQELGNISDRDAYETWCMGTGMIIITPSLDKVMEVASSHGIVSQNIGYVTDSPGIKIQNYGAFRDRSNKILAFP